MSGAKRGGIAESTAKKRAALFAASYIGKAKFDASVAAVAAGFPPGRGAKQRGYEMLQFDCVRKAVTDAISKRAERLNLTADDVLRGLHKDAVDADKASDRIHAWSWIGKHLKMFTDKVEVSGGLTLEQLVPKRVPRPANLDDQGNPT